MNATLASSKKAAAAKSSAVSTTAKPPISRIRKAVFIVIGLAALVLTLRFAYHAYVYEKSDDAFITAHLHLISPQISGTVVEVPVNENQVVHKGDILIKLDPLEFEIARDKARASLAQTEAQLIQTSAVVPYAEAQVSAAIAHADQADAQARQTAAQLSLAASNLSRTKQLFDKGSGVVTKADLDTAQSNFDTAQAADNAARSNLEAMQASVASSKVLLGAGPSQAQATQASIDSARAALRDAERQLSYTIIRAPSDGRIGNKNVETGNRVQVGQALFSVVEDNVWVVANFKETQLAHMQPGQPADIEIDALPGHDFHGHIDSFSPGTGALFTLLPPDNATGNFTKVVQRVPVKILLDPNETRDLQSRIHPGLSALVSIRVR
ncbi:MAG: HlyD family secretion protein [Chthoniobacterales bacterium]